MKQEVINQLDELIFVAEQNKNAYFTNKLISIKKTLLDEFNASDMYDEQIKKALNYDETISNLNDLHL